MPHVADLSVIIVNWNTRELLRDCLESLQTASNSIAIEVWVVDNASTDGSPEMVGRQFPWVNLVANGSNLGFAAANNLALERATGRHILLLNSDTLVTGEALGGMLAYLQSHAQVGAVGCRLLNSDGTVQRSCWQGFPSLKSALIDALFLWKLSISWTLMRSSEIGVADLRHPLRVDHLLGACVMVPREVVTKVGMLDEGYFLFLEETDWCRRMQVAGYEIHHLPHVSIVHHGEKSARKNPSMSLREYYRSYCRFCRRTQGYGWLRMQALKSIITAACVLRVGLWLGRMISSRRNLAGHMAAGYVRVLFALFKF